MSLSELEREPKEFLTANLYGDVSLASAIRHVTLAGLLFRLESMFVENPKSSSR
jgi:hypothetical protein